MGIKHKVGVCLASLTTYFNGVVPGGATSSTLQSV